MLKKLPFDFLKWIRTQAALHYAVSTRNKFT